MWVVVNTNDNVKGKTFMLIRLEPINDNNRGVARPFAIYADKKLVGFCMFSFAPKAKDPDDRYWLWRFMIDKRYQGRGYGQAALKEIIKYFCKYIYSSKWN